MLELVRQHAHHHVLRFFFLVLGGHDVQRVAVTVFAPQVFFVQPGVVGDDAVGGAQDADGRAVILRQLDDFQARVILVQLVQVFHVGTAPAINRLVVIAHCGKRARHAGEQFHNLVLAGVGVLVFVHQQVTQLLAPLFQHLGVAGKQLGRQPDQIIEIHRLIRLERVLIAQVNLGVGSVEVGFGAVQCGDGRHQRVFPRRDAPLRAADFLLVGGFQYLVYNLHRIGRIEDGKLRLVAQPPGFLAHDLHPKGVKRTHRQPLGRFALQQFGDARLHFARGLVGKGDGGDVLRRVTAFFNQIHDFLGDDAGLARTRTGQHQQRAIQVFDRFALGGIEMGQHGKPRRDRTRILT